MTLGEAGVGGTDERHFRSPSSIATAENGDIFVADGHEVNGNNRVMKFSKDGTLHQAVGQDRLRARRVPYAARHRHRPAGPHLRRRPQQQSHPALRPGGQAPLDLDAVRHAERDRLRRQGPDLCRRLGIGRREQSGLGTGHPHRRCADRLRDSFIWIRAATRTRKPEADRNSSPSTRTAASSAANPARACCGNTSRCGSPHAFGTTPAREMATWQYDFHLLPSDGVVHRYQTIQITISQSDFDQEQWWERSALPDDFVSEVSKLLPPMPSWSGDL